MFISKVLFFLFGQLIIGTNCLYYNDTPYLEHIQDDPYFREYYHPHYNQTINLLNSLSNSNELTQQCRSSLNRWIIGIKNKENWAIKFLESNGRTINGKLTGRNLNFGSFDFCSKFVREDAENVNFDGKYCLMSVQTKESEIIKTFSTYQYFYNLVSDRSKHILDFSLGNAHGLCLPSTCKIEEITTVINKMIKKYGFNLVPPKYCVSPSEPYRWDKVQIFASAILSIFIFLCFLSFFIKNNFLSNFSIIDNLGIIYAEPKEDEPKENLPLHFPKAIMMALSITAHTFFFFCVYFVQPYATIKELKLAKVFEIFGSRFIPFASQMFFLGGFYSCYAWLDVIKNKKIKVNFWIYLLARYVRIVIISIPIILITIILPHLGSGPYYSDITNQLYQNCKQNGYKIFFLSTNLNDGYIDMCTAGNWFLSADFHAAIFAYPLIYYLSIKPRIGFTIAIVQSIFFAFFTILYDSYNNVPAFINTLKIDIYDISKVQYYYFPFFYHYNTYLVGILSAYMFKMKKETLFTSNSVLRNMIWTILMGLCVWVFYYPYYLEENNYEGNKYLIVLYQIFNRTIIGLCVSWFFICTKFYHLKRLREFAELRIWAPISRLSFPISLGQFITIPYFFALSRSSFVFTVDHIIKELFFNYLITFIFANLVFVFFEGPLISIFKKLSGLKSRSEQVAEISKKSSTNDKLDFNMNLKQD